MAYVAPPTGGDEPSPNDVQKIKKDLENLRGALCKAPTAGCGGDAVEAGSARLTRVEAGSAELTGTPDDMAKVQ